MRSRRMVRAIILAAVINAAVLPAISTIVRVPLAFACSGQGIFAGPQGLGHGDSSTIAATDNTCGYTVYIQGQLNEQDPFANWYVSDDNFTNGYVGSNSGYTVFGAGIQNSPGEFHTLGQMQVSGSVDHPGYSFVTLPASGGY